MPEEKSRLVYSTETNIPRDKHPDKKMPTVSSHSTEQRIKIRLERKGRRGKSVTVIEGLKMSLEEQEALLKQIKKSLGTGGTLKDSTLEIQGDHRDALMVFLEKIGLRPIRSGG